MEGVNRSRQQSELDFEELVTFHHNMKRKVKEGLSTPAPVLGRSGVQITGRKRGTDAVTGTLTWTSMVSSTFSVLANIEGRIKIKDIFQFSMARALTKYDFFLFIGALRPEKLPLLAQR